MTCIVGIAERGKVWIGGDSASANDWEARPITQPKVFRNGPFLVGYTTSFRMGQILQYHLDVEGQTSGQTDMAYMVQVFVEAVRDCLKAHGFAKLENNVEEGGEFLVGYRGHLYHVDSNYAVRERSDGYDAVGCGRYHALGALCALSDLGPNQRIERALEAAVHFMGHRVMPPFRVLMLLRTPPYEGEGEDDGDEN